MKRTLSFLPWSVVIIFCLTVGAFAQERFGAIEGIIKDPNGAVVPGAQVTVTSRSTTGGARPDLSTAFNRTVSADSSGFYRLPDVPPGFYTVTVAATAGFGSAAAYDVQVVLGKATPVNISLALAGQSATVTVTGTEAAIDPSDNKIQTNITSQIAELLPKGVGVSSLWKIAPSTRPEALNGGFQVDGATGSENTFILDGQEVTHFRTGVFRANDNLPFSIVQETQIKSAGFEAEFGGATGGVINVVTKGGSNDWHGEFGVGFALGSWQGSPNRFLRNYRAGSATANPPTFIDIPEYIQPRKDAGNNYYPALTVSGPIKKDRLWFFTSWSPQFENTHRTLDYISSDPRNRTVSETLTYNLKRTRQFADVRLDAQLAKTLSLTGRFIWSPIVDEGALPAFSDTTGAPPEAVIGGQTLRGPAFLNQQGGRQNSNNITGSAVWIPSSRLVVNFRGGRTFLNEKLGSYGIPNSTRYLCSTSGSNTEAVKHGCVIGQTNFASNFQVPFDVSTRKTFDADASYLVNGLGGRHQFKFGYQYNGIENHTKQGYTDTGVLVTYWGLTIDNLTGQAPDPNAVGSGYLQRFGTVGAASSANQGVYFQDRWQVTPRLSLNLGIRLERETVPTFSPPNPGILFDWGSKPAPRLGFAWDPTGSGKSKIFASYGWFYDRFKYELPRGSFGGDFYRRDYFDLFANDQWNTITVAQVIGNFTDPTGGAGCDSDNPAVRIAQGARSRCQFDFRIPSNLVGGDVFASGAVDPDLKAMRQIEFTVGGEREFGRNFVFRARFTRKRLTRAIEDVGLPTASGSEAYIIANPGEGLAKKIATDLGYPQPKPIRKYDALELQLDRRFANHYFFNLNYTYSRLFGNYSGLASSQEFGRTSPNVSRLWDLPWEPFALTGEQKLGRLPTDRPHALKAYGSYDARWNGRHNTEFGGFFTAQSGTPVTSVVTFYNLNPTVVSGFGDLGRTQAFLQTDFSVRHKIRFGKGEKYALVAELDILNLFDQRREVRRSTTQQGVSNITGPNLVAFGCAACTSEINSINALFNGGIKDPVLSFINSRVDRQVSTYNLANGFQDPRSMTFGFRFIF